MIVLLSDDEIAELTTEPKSFPDGPWPPRLKQEGSHRRADIGVEAPSGSEFVIKIRQSDLNHLDFSIILGYRIPGSYTVFRLRRHNGKSHWHTNPIEEQTFFDFHIHKATERYQALGAREDHYAEVTSRYRDLNGALECMLEECGFGRRTVRGPLFI
jgi:hypothetical protein